MGCETILRVLAIGVVAVGTAAAVELSDLPLEELASVPVEEVVGASRYQQPVWEAPSSVTVITREDIRDFGWETLAELLRAERGMHLRYDRFYDYLGNRGFSRPGDYNSRTLVLVNGHRVNDVIYQQGSVGREFVLDLDMVDRVEVIRGPSSSVYGGSAFFGVVNVIPRDGRSLSGGEVQATVGNRGRVGGRVSYGAHGGTGWDVSVSASVSSTEGEDRLRVPPETPVPERLVSARGAAVDGADGEWWGNAIVRLVRGDVILEGAYVRRRKEVPPVVYRSWPEPTAYATDERRYVRAEWRREVAAGAEVSLRAALDGYRYRGSFSLSEAEGEEDFVDVERRVVADDNGVSLRPEADGAWLTLAAEARHRFSGGHTLVYGVEWLDAFEQELRNREELTGTDLVNVSESSDVISAYVQADLRLSERWGVSVGLRHDEDSLFGSTTNPRVGVIGQVGEGGTVKFLYGTAFRAPNADERFAQAVQLVRNPDLGPEKVQTYEAVWEQRVPGGRVTASAYHYSVRGQIDLEMTEKGDSRYQNLDRVSATGLEIGVDGYLPGRVRLRASAAYQRTRIDDAGSRSVVPGADAEGIEGERLGDSPSWLAKLGLVVPIGNRGVRLGYEAQWTAARTSRPVFDAPTERVSGYLVQNVNLRTGRWLEPVEIVITARNVENASWEDPPTTADPVAQPGREIRVSLNWGY